MGCDWEATHGARKGWFSRDLGGRQLYVRESLPKDAWKGWQAILDGFPIGVHKTEGAAQDALMSAPETLDEAPRLARSARA